MRTTCPTSSSSTCKRASRWLCVPMCMNCYLLYICNSLLLISLEPWWLINASKTPSLHLFELFLHPEEHVGYPGLLLLLLPLCPHIPLFSPASDLLYHILKVCMSFYNELEDNTNMTKVGGAIEYYSEDVDEKEKAKETNSRVRGDSKD